MFINNMSNDCEKWTDQHDTSVDNEKIRFPGRNLTHDLPHTGQMFYPLNYMYEDSWRARSFNWVYMWQVS